MTTATGQQAPLDVVVVGAGFAGLGMGIQLKRAGITAFRILERAPQIGGCWRDNVYPGLCCDIPSHLYSYSFELNPKWSQKFAPGREIWEYLEHCKRKYGLERFISYGAEVQSARFDDGTGLWTVHLASGERITARFLVAAQGALTLPNTPDIPGLESFEGPVMHTARWNPQFDARGKRIAVIGNAASGVQAIPQLAQQAAHVYVFQRTPNWVFPRGSAPISAATQAIYRWVPGAMRLKRLAIYLEHEMRYFALKNPRGRMAKFVRKLAKDHLEKSISDPELRRKLTPDYEFGCKRMLISDDYFPALTRPNVTLITDPIERAGSREIATPRARVEVDAVVLATGYRVQEMLSYDIIGRDGQSMNALWKTTPEAYLGVVAAGFPNLFLPGGPNSAPGHTSFILVLENHINYAVRCIARALESNYLSMEVRDQVQANYNKRMQDQLKNMVWSSGCKNWYTTAGGRVFTQVPGFSWQYARKLRRPKWSDFVIRSHDATPPTDSDLDKYPSPAFPSSGLAGEAR
ncbi:MAG: NAD(P)/FAD-dependent oxidoreductase [Beijerinckiaceae bacterium]|nr:NAD(P)/FAD-dependent oxidoreductase [Beijerinckiaceae bacterium]